MPSDGHSCPSTPQDSQAVGRPLQKELAENCQELGESEKDCSCLAYFPNSPTPSWPHLPPSNPGLKAGLTLFLRLFMMASPLHCTSVMTRLPRPEDPASRSTSMNSDLSFSRDQSRASCSFPGQRRQANRKAWGRRTGQRARCHAPHQCMKAGSRSMRAPYSASCSR